MLGRTDSRARLLLLLAAMTVLSGSLMLRLAYWQLGQRDQLVAMARANAAGREEDPSLRGTILDRNGVVLAKTVYLDRLIGSPGQLFPDERERVANSLVGLLGLGDSQAATTLRSAMASDSNYTVLATNLDPSVSQRIRSAIDDGTLGGVSLEPRPVRVYPQPGGAPNTSLASQLLGFVNSDGQGQYGVEQAYNAVLAGRPRILATDPTAQGPGSMQVVDPGQPGEDIRLTVDAGLQLSLEQEVYAAWVADKARTVSALVLDPHSGAILAESSYPSYDANDYQAIAARNPSLFMDPVVSQVYEPGSVFKMLLASAALQHGTTTLATRINDYGVYRLPDGTEVADANRQAMGWMKFEDIVAWSRNVGVTQVALRLGKTLDASSTILYDTWRSYGFGQPSGVDLAGEVGGLVNDPAKQAWRPIDLANGSFGQGVAVTPLQLLRAYTAMANGGTLLQPYVAQRAAAQAQAQATRVITPGLSSTLTGLLKHVVTSVPYYAQGALIPGYLVGGKTGTAQIWDPTLNGGRGGWKNNIFNYSFYGYVGQTSPDLMIGLMINEGTPTMVAQGVLPLPVDSFVLFRRIAADSVNALHMPPQPAVPSASPSTSTAPAG